MSICLKHSKFITRLKMKIHMWLRTGVFKLRFFLPTIVVAFDSRLFRANTQQYEQKVVLVSGTYYV